MIFDEKWWEKQILCDKLELIANPDADEEEEKDDGDYIMDQSIDTNEMIEEYDGLNDNFAFFVVLVNLHMLMRGHSIKILTQGKKIKINL